MRSEQPFFQILSACLRSRCPVCHKGRLFLPLAQVRSVSHLFLPPDRCDSCGFRFARESGYFLGVLTPTLPILSLATGILFTAVFYLAVHPADPLQLLLPGGIGTGVGFILSFRPSISIFISLDHFVDPPKPKNTQTS